jgi:hypothetical protein
VRYSFGFGFRTASPAQQPAQDLEGVRLVLDDGEEIGSSSSGSDSRMRSIACRAIATSAASSFTGAASLRNASAGSSRDSAASTAARRFDEFLRWALHGCQRVACCGVPAFAAGGASALPSMRGASVQCAASPARMPALRLAHEPADHRAAIAGAQQAACDRGIVVELDACRSSAVAIDSTDEAVGKRIVRGHHPASWG